MRDSTMVVFGGFVLDADGESVGNDVWYKKKKYDKTKIQKKSCSLPLQSINICILLDIVINTV